MLECVPNFSEGRRPAVISALQRAARSVPGVRLLDTHSDTDHNRCVLTLVGESRPLQEAIFRTVQVAVQEIDLRHHTGNHPRLGAADVVPFVPLPGASMRDAIAAAHDLGQRLAQELNLPVYFYEEAALRPERSRLEHVRAGGFDHLRELTALDGKHHPDLGPPTLHPSAGAVIVGARRPLIAYNIYLNTDDLAVAHRIARKVRYSSGGLRYVKALGIDIPSRGGVQVSMNLTHYEATAMHTVFELVKEEAAAYGLTITGSEVVGLLPLAALADAARHYLRLHDFRLDQILEVRLQQEDPS